MYVFIQPIYKPQLFVRISVQVAIVNSSYRTKDHEDVHVSGERPGNNEILQGFGPFPVRWWRYGAPIKMAENSWVSLGWFHPTYRIIGVIRQVKTGRGPTLIHPKRRLPVHHRQGPEPNGRSMDWSFEINSRVCYICLGWRLDYKKKHVPPIHELKIQGGVRLLRIAILLAMNMSSFAGFFQYHATVPNGS